MLKAKLVVVGGDAKAAEVALNLPTTIGRGRVANLTLPHPLVSRNHCELFERDGVLHVRDLKSLNGTYVDNKRIEETAILKPDQLLTIGNVTFRAIYSADAIADVPVNSAPADSPINSNVIEFEEVASADSESKIDPVHSKPDIEETVSAKELAEQARKAKLAAQLRETTKASDVLQEEPQATPQPQHSIVAAMQQQVGEAAAALDRTSMADLRGQLGDLASGAAANPVDHVDGLVVDSDQAPAAQVDFSSIDIDETIGDKVSADESALGSFIRKMPR